MRRKIATELGGRLRFGVLAAFATILVLAGTAGATNIGALQSRVDRARSQAGALATKIRTAQDRLNAARQRAAVASAREARLSALLANGRRRAARLAARVARSQRRLAAEKRRLRRARGVLARRLVAIYEGGSPSTLGAILESSNLEEFAVRTEYLRRIQLSDTELATRVEQVRNAMRKALELVAALKARVEAYDERLAGARSQIAAVRSAAEAASSRLRSLAAARSASLASLKSRIGVWVRDIEAAEAASRAAAEETVGRWLGGPYSIPTYIVMCESGGNYSALNPSSGAGGAYQVLPSTWALYGGQGNPEEASKAEQDRIAAEIWADSGPSAWSCAG